MVANNSFETSQNNA